MAVGPGIPGRRARLARQLPLAPSVDGFPGGRPPPAQALLVFLLLRYLLLGCGGYVIVKFFGLNLTAALLGLFVAIAAVIFEILYELIYARA